MPDSLIVGIDFGTTFSGVAAAYGGSPEAPDELNIIKTWPGGNNITSDKVPSEITYINIQDGTIGGPSTSRPSVKGERRLLTPSTADSTPAGGDDPFDFSALNTALDKSQFSISGDAPPTAELRWGLLLHPGEERLRCLKLFLDPGQPLPSYVSLPDIERQLEASGKDVRTAVTDYLQALFAHTKEMLVRRYGSQFVETTKLTVVLTVPAVWSDAAKDVTLKAAEAAGMGDSIGMISEPEAAAVYALQAIQPNHLKVGHNFVVIDAGGGTVDLISYAIRQLTPLRLEEVVEGSGGCCGAAFLNVGFEDFVRSRLGSSAFDKICASKPRSWIIALRYFEDYVKRNFDPEEQMVFNIPFPGIPDDEKAGIEDGFLVMDHNDVADLFRPLIANIIKLVEGQISKLEQVGHVANGLILVGGFGQSECLLKCLQARFGASKRGIEIMQPVNAWTAVVRGAVLRGLEGAELVLNRKARRHYGVQWSPSFDPRIHPASCKRWDDLVEREVAGGRMKWYIHKGDTASSTAPILFPFSNSFTPNASKTVTKKLIICDVDTAPTGFDSSPGGLTRTACQMVVNLSSVPQHLWKEVSQFQRPQPLTLELRDGNAD